MSNEIYAGSLHSLPKKGAVFGIEIATKSMVVRLIIPPALFLAVTGLGVACVAIQQRLPETAIAAALKAIISRDDQVKTVAKIEADSRRQIKKDEASVQETRTKSQERVAIAIVQNQAQKEGHDHERALKVLEQSAAPMAPVIPVEARNERASLPAQPEHVETYDEWLARRAREEEPPPEFWNAGGTGYAFRSDNH
jgi:hypothetical protein